MGGGTNRWGLFSIQIWGVLSVLFLGPWMCVKRCKDNRDMENYSQEQQQQIVALPESAKKALNSTVETAKKLNVLEPEASNSIELELASVRA